MTIAGGDPCYILPDTGGDRAQGCDAPCVDDGTSERVDDDGIGIEGVLLLGWIACMPDEAYAFCGASSGG